MVDKKLQVFAKKIVAQLERQHKAGQKSVAITFHRLKKHSGSYKPGSKPVGGKSMPSKPPKGFTKEASGIFGLLTKKSGILKKLFGAAKSQILDHVKRHGRDMAKDIARASAGAIAKRANRLMTGAKSKIQSRVGLYKTKADKHIGTAISRVESFLSKHDDSAKLKRAAVRLFQKK